ncbi:Z1 domain-containing protein [Dactylosporangium sp. NPDC050688]|uniref:Z1 domain-containing protein n=1 Tax=Dactylosporangium sp. NPDC050688 TaxID=3157217 RepID=UPI0033F5F01E
MTVDDDLGDQYEVFQSILEKATPEKAVARLRVLQVPEHIIEELRKRHEADVIKIREMREPHVVYRSGRLTWYTGPQEGDRFWPALEKTLRTGERPWGDEAIRALDSSSTKVVGLLDHPAVTSFRSMGLVLGYVQSGKTANFTAVMAKAADRGYRLFIVLSGIHNALRRQTQSRLARELVQANPAQWHQVTTVDHDFHPPANAAAFLASHQQRVLLVVKKNAKVLAKLNRWLASARDYLQDCPTVVIDDEADQATVGGKRINPLIGDLLKVFTRAVYVGYTATPFANLLIDPSKEDDFYPRDFVVGLEKPKGYQGPELLFGRDPLEGEDPGDVAGGEDMIRIVPDEDVEFVQPKGKSAASFEPEMTPSLRDAVLYFWLATAARRVRRTGVPHSTMLVHTTLNTWVHEMFRDPLDDLRRAALSLLKPDDLIADGTFVAELRDMWTDETARVAATDFGEKTVSFDEVLAELPGVIADSRVVVDNHKSRDRLDYESGPVVAIAVGGNTLSRGLTLEGLVSSYFVRASSTYDTLLQMGRWFGHRAGYADLPRIWMTQELAEWFRHIAVVEAEIRKDIDRYLVEDKNPLTFAVRIQTHPKMLVTAPARMKDAVKAQAAYGGDLVETRYFHVDDRAWLEDNVRAADNLMRAASEHARDGQSVDETRRQWQLWRDVSYTDVLRFVEEYSFHDLSQNGRRDLIRGYIEKRIKAGELLSWDVAVIGNSKKDARRWKLPDGRSLGMHNRSRLNLSPDSAADIKTLSSARDTAVNLTVPGGVDDGRRLAIEKLRRVQRPKVGLLLLYPIDPVSPPVEKKGREPLNATHDVVMGAAFVFPEPTGADSTVTYDYVSADLSKVYVEQEDPTILEGDDEDDASV